MIMYIKMKSFIIQALLGGSLLIASVSCTKNASLVPVSATDSALLAEKATAIVPACLAGEWTYKSASGNLSFVFNGDYTGYEDIGNGDGPRNFTWTCNGNKVSIVYESESTSWDLSLNCEEKMLSVMGLGYSKK
jgi:hypothetical protein